MDADPDPTFEQQIDKKKHQNMTKFIKICHFLDKNGFIL